MSRVESRIVYAPSIPRSYALAVGRHSGNRVTAYQHVRFSCGESFSKPLKSLRGKEVTVLGTFNPQTAVEDAMRLQIMLDGLRRMEVWKVDFVIPYFPQVLELSPLFSGIDSLTTIELSPSAYFTGRNRKRTQLPLGRLFMREGVTRILSIPVFNLSSTSLFKKHFASPPGVHSFVKVRSSEVRFRRSKSGKKIVGLDFKTKVTGRKVAVLQSEVKSLEILKRIVGTLYERKAEEVHLGITHAVFSEEVLRELEENAGIARVVTTDTIGIPGEKFLKDGIVQGVPEPFLPSKFTVLSTAKLVAEACQNLAYFSQIPS